MAAESAVLGTPAIYVNTLTMGYTNELDERYGLLFNYQDDDRHSLSLDKAVSILEGDEDWDEHRARLLDDKVDTTDVILRAVTGRSRHTDGQTHTSGAEV